MDLKSDVPPSLPKIYTVGHSNRTLPELIDILHAHQIGRIVDIRAIPYSAYNPQFNREEIASALEAAGISYRHDADLAGNRPDRQTMSRAVRCSDRSGGYWKYMESGEFRNALSELIDRWTPTQQVALMCGEAQPEHCHRYQTSHAIEGAGAEVVHIIDATTLRIHQPQLF